MIERRDFLKNLAGATGAVVLLPVVSRCGGESEPVTTEEPAPAEPTAGNETEVVEPEPDPLAVPQTKPAGWDAIAFNRERGNAGAIPESYRDEINGPDGVTGHLGKHLPYFATVDAAIVPAGYVALMWGDPAEGYTRHPNAPRSEDNPDGHWYDWIRVRKAVEGETEELESAYSNWPETEDGDNGRYVALDGSDVTADSGKNTVYLVAIPEGVAPGDEIRIHAHCLTHG